MKIEGSVAVIIGAAQGIGKAIVNRLLQLGAKVYFGDIEEDAGLETLKEFREQYGSDRVYFQKCDITRKPDIRGLFEAATTRWSRIDIFSPVAGIILESEWESSIQVNLVGGIQSVKEVMKHMAKDQGGAGGVIIMMSSLTGYQPFYTFPVYGSTKSALLSFARSMGSEESFAHHGIRFNCLCPSYTDTQLYWRCAEDRGRCSLHPDECRTITAQASRAQPSSVAAAFIRCVEDDTMKGQALQIENRDGNDVVERVSFAVTSEKTLEILPGESI